jgi:hypothetical protein
MHTADQMTYGDIAKVPRRVARQRAVRLSFTAAKLIPAGTSAPVSRGLARAPHLSLPSAQVGAITLSVEAADTRSKLPLASHSGQARQWIYRVRVRGDPSGLSR